MEAEAAAKDSLSSGTAENRRAVRESCLSLARMSMSDCGGSGDGDGDGDAGKGDKRREEEEKAEAVARQDVKSTSMRRFDGTGASALGLDFDVAFMVLQGRFIVDCCFVRQQEIMNERALD